MIDSLKKIGCVIRQDNILRFEYHPLMRTIRYNEKNKYLYYEINIDTVNNCINYKNNGKSIPCNEDLMVLKYDLGGNTFPYIIGNYEYSGGKAIKSNSLLKYQINCDNLGITNDLILKVNNVLDNNKPDLDVFFNNITTNLDNIFIIVKIDNREFTDYPQILDEIDRIYINNLCEIDNGYYILKNDLYSFYGVSYINKIGQVPNFNYKNSYKSLPLNFNDISNLIYGENFHSNRTKTLIGDYIFNFLPCGETIKDIIIDSKKAKNIATSSTFISNNSEVDEYETNDSILDMFKSGFNFNQNTPKEKISFDIIFKLKGGHVNNDIMILSNYNLTYLEELNNKFNEIKKLLFNEKMKYFPMPKNAFIKIFKKDKCADSKDVNKIIFGFLIQFYKGDFYGSDLIDKYFIENFMYKIRNNENTIKNDYSDLILNYKIIRYMENNGVEKFNNELNDNSYLLGKCLGVISQTWQDDRKNLEQFVSNFNGQISRRIKRMADVNDYFNQIVQRLSRNKCYINGSNITLFSELSNKIETLNVTLFIRGYFESQYQYVNKSSK